MPMHQWHNSPYVLRGVSRRNNGRSPAAAAALGRLLEGNGRFVGGHWRYKPPRNADTAPSAIVIGGSEYRVPVEDLPVWWAGAWCSAVAASSVDRTAYSPKYSLSFMSHHAERISLSVVRGVNRAIRSHLATLSARLARA